MISATYYDGVTTRRHEVTFMIHKRVLMMRGEGLKKVARISSMDISERLDHSPRLLRFAEGDFIEVQDPALIPLLKKNRYREPRVVRWQQNWPLSLLSLVILISLLLTTWQWGVPRAADQLAQHLPTTLEHKLGDESLAVIDRQVMRPTHLPPAIRTRIETRFGAMEQPRGERTPYRLEFRHSLVGPNAITLPNGVIIMTDELVEVAGNDDAVMATLAHELGHLQRRHMLRGLMQTAGIGVVLNMWIGDATSALAAVPALLLGRKYSRDFEREADQYAIDMMQTNHVPLKPMAEMFRRMNEMQSADQDDGESEGENGDTPKRRTAPNYLSSHPADEERIAYLLAADAGK